MKKFIYYPNFEPPNDEWLKFSLLYLDKLESIIPYNREYLISDNYRKIRDKTDLVDFFSPEFHQGEQATLNSIIEAERILNRTYETSFQFNRVNVARDWKNRATWDYQIFGEKFSYSWVRFCEENKIGEQNSEGIKLPKSLAFIYMTHLAKQIAHERNGSIITDNVEYDFYTSSYRVNPQNPRVRNKFIQGIIKLQVPKNISSISFNNLIEFRNKNKELINSFNNQINLVEENIGNGISEKQFIENYNFTFRELVEEIKKLGLEIATVPFAFYTLAQNTDALNQEYIKEILTGLGIVATGYYGIRKSITDNRDRLMCKKYLTRLHQLT